MIVEFLKTSYVYPAINFLQMSDAQTFHYSHGWTNGKRSVLAPLPQRRSVPAAQSKPIEADYDVKVEYGQGAEEENRVKVSLIKRAVINCVLFGVSGTSLFLQGSKICVNMYTLLE